MSPSSPHDVTVMKLYSADAVSQSARALSSHTKPEDKLSRPI